MIACLLALDSATSYWRGFRSFTFLLPTAVSAASLAPLSSSLADTEDLANTLRPVAMKRARTSLCMAALAASSIARSVASSPCCSSMRRSVRPSMIALGCSVSTKDLTKSLPEGRPNSSATICGSRPSFLLVILSASSLRHGASLASPNMYSMSLTLSLP